MMQRFLCPRCGRAYPVDQNRWRCDCGSFLDLEFNPSFPVKAIKRRPPTLWRYREALPVLDDKAIVSMGEGFTPLESMDVGGVQVLMKIDYLFPTGSYKDRGATVLISKAKELGIKRVIEDSSGNAGSAMAAYCAKAGIECDIYVPESTSPEKLVQIETYGAGLRKVAGSRERTADVTIEAAATVYYASHCWNPFFLHGTKTFAFEVWEQLGGKSPDAVVLPVGHGTLFLGTHIGFKELKEAGLVKTVPRLVGIQAASCAPLHRRFIEGSDREIVIEKKETLAEGIAIAKPIRWRQVLEAVGETGGEILTVTEAEIMAALREMGRRGHYIEPTSAATVAGLKKNLKHLKKKVVVSSLTGTGLKATEKIGHLPIKKRKAE